MKIKKEKIFFVLIFLVGVFVRIYNFGAMPNGLNQDEAFAGYEAFSMLKYGMDSWGCHNPVYFVSWGSGMNVLSSYLMMPFIAIFGNSVLAVRMPQLIASISALWVFYLVLKECIGIRCALIGMFVLAICPWHIMVSRWALESNMAPHMWLFGFYFFMKALKDNRFLPLSMFFYGLSLYAYATMWFFVPLSLLLLFVYFKKQIKSIKMFLISAGLLFLLSLPLILFVLVNIGVIDEIKTSFISIPRLLYMRSGEMSLSNILKSQTYINIFNILIKQNDSLAWNSNRFGTYYHAALPFILFGIIRVLKEKNNLLKAVAINTAVAVFVMLLMSGANINKVNFIHFPMLMLFAVGLEGVLKIGYRKVFLMSAVSFLCIFSMFLVNYFTDYNREVSGHFDAGIEKAINNLPEGEIFVDSEIYYPKILFLSAQDTDEYLKTVAFSNYPSAYLRAESFGRFCFTNNFENMCADTYIVKKDKRNYFKKADYKAEYYDEIIIFRKLGTF